MSIKEIWQGGAKGYLVARVKCTPAAALLVQFAVARNTLIAARTRVSKTWRLIAAALFDAFT